jgi:hypothetical protein
MDTRASRSPRDRCREVVGADQCVTAQRSVWPAHPTPNASGAGYAAAGDASTGPGSATTATVTLVAAGQAVAIIPGSPPPGSIRPDLTTIPPHGIEPGHISLATRAADRTRLVAASPVSRTRSGTFTAPGVREAE